MQANSSAPSVATSPLRSKSQMMRPSSPGVPRGIQTVKRTLFPDTPTHSRHASVASSSSIANPAKPLRVYLRVRPLLESEKASRTACVVSESGVDGTEAQMTLKGETHTFRFTRVMPQETAQDGLFREVAEPMCERSLRFGTDAFLFAYGVSNSGKTHTVTGRTGEDACVVGEQEGLAGRVAERLIRGRGERNLEVVMSYLEVYNEIVKDLLVPKSTSHGIKVVACGIEDGGETVVGLTEVEVDSVAKFHETLALGQSRRATAQTAMNSESSRSHAVLMLQLRLPASADKENSGARPVTPRAERARRKWSRFWLVDMAGSERACRTAATGARLAEASSINNSLMVFGRCMTALASTEGAPQLPPVRESKLTMMLAGCFTDGEADAAMIVNASPGEADVAETANALRFSAVAQKIVRDVRWSLSSPGRASLAPQSLASSILQRELREKDEQVAELHRQLEATRRREEEASSSLAAAMDELATKRRKIEQFEHENSELREELEFAHKHFDDVVSYLSNDKKEDS